MSIDSITARDKGRRHWRPPMGLALLALIAAYVVGVRIVGLQNAQRLTFTRPATTAEAHGSVAPVDRFLARCPTRAELQAIDTVVELRFDSDPTGREGELACHAAEGSRDMTAFQKRVYNAIRLMGEIRFDQPLPWTSKTLLDWFADAADTVLFVEDLSLSFCCRPAGVINLRTHGLAISETDRFIDADLNDGVASFILLLAHETRHAEGFRHTCGTNADLRLTEMGAWGLQYSLDLWFAEHSESDFLSAPGTDYHEFFLADAQRIVQAYFCLQPTPVPAAVDSAPRGAVSGRAAQG